MTCLSSDRDHPCCRIGNRRCTSQPMQQEAIVVIGQTNKKTQVTAEDLAECAVTGDDVIAGKEVEHIKGCCVKTLLLTKHLLQIGYQL